MERPSTTNISERITAPDTNSFDLTRADAAFCAALVSVVLAMFWKVIFAGQMLFYRDILNQTYPEMKFVHEITRRGLLPYWNPYLNFGQPLLANPNSLFFYPTTLLIILLPVRIAFQLHFVLHFALAAVGAYFLARAWRLSRYASFFAALIFVLSGPVLSLGSFYNEVAAAAWIPWLLFLTDRALRAGSARRWVLLSVVFALQFLAGEPFTFLATFILCLAYAFHQRGTFRPIFSRTNRVLLLAFFGVGALMLGVVAVQLIPASGLLSHSLRGKLGMPFGQTTYWSLHPLSLLEMVLPGFFGPLFSAPSLWTSVLNFSNRPFFPSIFLGFVPLFLSAVACVAGRNRRRKFAVWSAAILLLLALGRFTPVFSLAYLLFPPLELVRFPIKLLVLFSLLVALLAGWGVDDLSRSSVLPREPCRKLLELAVVCFGVVTAVWILSWLAPQLILAPAEWILRATERTTGGSGGAMSAPRFVEAAGSYFILMVRWHFLELAAYALGGVLWVYALNRRSRWAARALPLALALGIAELVAMNYGVNPAVPPSFYDYRPPVLDHFQPSSMPYRYSDIFGSSAFASATGAQAFALLDFRSIPAARNLSQPALSEFQERLLLEHGGMLFKRESITNTDVDLSFPQDLFEFWVYALHEAPGFDRAACLFGRVNVRYQIIGRAVSAPDLAQVAEIPNGSPHAAYLYENRCFVSRAFVAGEARHSPSDEETLATLSSPDFDPLNEVLVDEKAQDSASGARWGSAGRVESFDESPNQVTLKASLSRPGYVVLLDRFDANWRATLDGREVPVLRADLLFRAVRAGPGRNEIRFYYRQRGLLAGLLITLFTLAIALAFWVLNPKVSWFDSDARKEEPL
jgi:hypothetical protein